METKAKINLKEGTLELEGSEEFVKSYLDEFKKFLFQGSPKQIELPHSNEQNGTAPSSQDKPVPKKVEPSKSKNFIKNPDPIDFDVKQNGTKPSLRDFINSKNPQSHRERVACVAVYLKKYLGIVEFNEGHISHAYLSLAVKRPEAFHQLFLDAKNDNRWIIPGEGGQFTWKLYSIGEDFVEHDLPKKNIAP